MTPPPMANLFGSQEELIRRVREAMPTIVILLGPGGRILSTNAYLERLTGYREQEVLGQDWCEIFLPERDRERVRAVIDETFAGRATQGRRHPLVTRSGLELAVEWRNQPILNDDGETVAIVSVGMDVTAEVHAEAAERWSETRFDSLVEQSPRAIALYDAETRIVYQSPAVKEILGYEPEELIGRVATSLCHPEDLPMVSARMPEVLSTPGAIGKLELRLQHKDGEYRWVEFIGTNLLAEPSIGAVVGSYRDITERKRAEAELLASEARLRVFVEHATDAVFLFAEGGEIVDVNERACEGLGYTREELSQLQPTDLDPDTTPEFLQDLRTRLTAGETVTFETRHRRKDGVCFPVDVRVRPFVENGKRFSVALARDITQRRLTERNLRESEARFRTLFEAAPFAIALNSLTGEYTAVNPAFEQLSGYRASEVLGRTARETGIVSPDPDQELRNRELLREFGRLDNVEAITCTRSGDVRNCLFSTRTVVISDTPQFLSVSIDITDRKRVEEALRASEVRLAEAQRIAHVGNWTWNSATDEIVWSDEVYRILGHPPGSFVPRYQQEFLAAVHPDDRAAVREGVKATMASGLPFVIEHRIFAADGSERYVREKGEVILNDAGVSIGMHGTVQDITERVLAEQQMKTLHDELAHVARVSSIGELAAGIAHELNQPLAAIANYAFTTRSHLTQLVAERRSSPLSDGLSLLTNIEEQAIRAGDIIRRLQGMIRNQPSQRVRVPLRRLVTEVGELLSSDIRLAQVDLTLNTAASLPPVHVDPVQIQQVLVNLIRNSIESMRKTDIPRQLEISAAAEGENSIRVSVRDTGSGLSDEIRERLFQPFITTRREGLGLGLAISKRIIEAHGGEISLGPASPAGLEVQFTLPIAE